MPNGSSLQIRKARRPEAEALASKAPGPPRRGNGRRAQQTPQVFVAEVAGRRVGFAVLVGDEIRTIELDPRWAEEGVGARLLARLERAARSGEVSTLKVRATERAGPFFRAHGYRGSRRVRLRLASGEEVSAVLLRKSLAPALGRSTSLKERSRANRELREAEHLGAAFLGA